MDNSEPAALMEETLSEEADRIDIAHALLRNKVHGFSEDDLHRFSDDGASDSTDTTADPIVDGTAKSDDPKAPHDGAAAQGAAPPSPAMSARSARDDAVGAHALGDTVTVVGGDGRRMHEGIVRFVGATRFASHAWGRCVAI